ncbi:MAG: hypothetical protein R3D26_03325 [Cyanobacteriota/Melainabacteria group bacterium]
MSSSDLPLITLMELTTEVGTRSFGGELSTWSYGMLWYEAHPTASGQIGLDSGFILGRVLYSLPGSSMLPALFFRPHPLATLIGYTVPLSSPSI